MSPLQIKILLHYHTCKGDHPDVYDASKAEWFKDFLTLGYLKKCVPSMCDDAMLYKPTEKLHVYCEALTKVPEPKQVWVVE